MLKKIAGYTGLIIGFILGFFLLKEHGIEVVQATVWTDLEEGVASWGFAALGGAFMGIFFYFLTPLLASFTGKAVSVLDAKLKTFPTQDILLVVFALLITLLISILLSILLSNITGGAYLSIAISALLVYLGVRLVMSRKEEFDFITSLLRKNSSQVSAGDDYTVKVLDTSVIIDGRIIDICKAGFMEGTLVVPEFVLEELRHIADSPDLLKRNRGRRGLDILNKIQKELDIPVRIYEGDFEDISEVDSKLVKLAKVLHGKIVTNDFNLNKVCELQGVHVLNINELANAVKPVVLPGEEMHAQIIKDGKEAGQGIAYLDDGTMIVVENGKRYIGENVEVLVTSVLQTAAGRMIFAKPKSASEKISGVK